MNESGEVSLDELFDEQKKSAGRLLATLEPVANDPERVRVTPWIPGRGCICAFALTIDRRHIARLLATKHRHRCCGQVLQVVDVELTEQSAMPLREVFADLTRRAALPSMTKSSGVRRRGRTVRRRRPSPFYRFARLPTMIGDGFPSGWSGGEGGDEGDDGDDGDDDGEDGETASYPDYSYCMDDCVHTCMNGYAGSGVPYDEAMRRCELRCDGQCRGSGFA